MRERSAECELRRNLEQECFPRTSLAFVADGRTHGGSSVSVELAEEETKIEGAILRAVQMPMPRAESGGEGIRTPGLLRVRETS
jgi:hypothetical protein